MSIYAMVWAYEQDVTNSGEKFTLVTAAQYCNDEGICWVKQETLAQDMSMDRRSVLRHLDRLENQHKLVERKERRRKDGTRASDLIKLVGFSKVTKRHSDTQQGDKNDTHQGDNLSQQETSVEETLSNKPPKGGTGEPVPDEEFQAWHIKEYIRSGLEENQFEYTRPSLQPYSWAASRLHKRDTDPEDLYEAADRVIAEWPRIRLKLDDALKDIRNDAPSGSRVEQKTTTAKNGTGTPPEAIEYVFANAVGECFRNNEARIRRAMEQHNFTGYEYPSYPVQKMLGGTDQEIWQAMDGLESLLGRWKREEQRS